MINLNLSISRGILPSRNQETCEHAVRCLRKKEHRHVRCAYLKWPHIRIYIHLIIHMWWCTAAAAAKKYHTLASHYHRCGSCACAGACACSAHATETLLNVCICNAPAQPWWYHLYIHQQRELFFRGILHARNDSRWLRMHIARTQQLTHGTSIKNIVEMLTEQIYAFRFYYIK